MQAALALHGLGIRFVTIDLAGELGGSIDPDSYYQGFLEAVTRQLHISLDLSAFWKEHASETFNQRFLRFFREVATTDLKKPLVVFLDEIDSTLKLPFTDDLFTAIRTMYNERTLVEAYERVTFCLLGVATPNELIKDRRTTPYNVGYLLELRDFDKEIDDLSILQSVLNPDVEIGARVLDRILYWTGGHPYLTIKLCAEISITSNATQEDIDQYVNTAFTELDRVSGDSHFQQIQRFLQTRLSDESKSLNIYERILEGYREQDQATLSHTELKLSGLVKRDVDGFLVIRNRIYHRLFNSVWIVSTRPKQTVARYRRLGMAATIASIIIIGASTLWYIRVYIPMQRVIKPLALVQQAEEASARGDFELAEKLYNRSLAISKDLLGPNDTSFVTTLTKLARLYSDQGLYAQAEPLYQRALLILEKTYGPEHPQVAQALDNIAGLYNNIGQYAQAEPLYQRALLILEKTYGPEHPQVAQALNNIAGLYNNLGRYDQAVLFYKKSLLIRRKALGPNNPEVLAALNNLAIALLSLGQQEPGTARLEEAVTVLRSAVDGYARKALPQQWASTQNNLGNALREQGTRTGGEAGAELLTQAVTAYREALTVYTRESLPQQWAMTQNNLGNALREQGTRTGGEAGAELLTQAVTAYREALTVYTRESLPQQWAMTQNNLGNALREQGTRTGGEAGAELLTQAVTAYREALTVYTRESLPQQWAMTQNNLGNALQEQGTRTGGEAGAELLTQTVAAYREALKEYTRDRIPLDWAMTQNNLGNALSSLGERESGTERLEEAVAAYQEALKEYTRDRVPLDWAMTQNNLGNALSSLGERESGTERLEEAVAAYQEALKEFERGQNAYYVEVTKGNLKKVEDLIQQQNRGNASK